MTDLSMPNVSGWDVAKHIKMHGGKSPVILTTGHDVQLDKAELSEKGVRFRYQGPSQLIAGLEIEIDITFSDGESFRLKGEILRVTKEDAIMRFSGSLTTNRLMKEQLFIKNNVIFCR